MQTHKGTCHCGRVKFEARAELDSVTECNCSVCTMKGALWHRATEGDLRIVSGEADLTLYQFNTKTAKHYFCKHCGIHVLSRPRLDPSLWVFNVRCVAGVDATALKRRTFDGQNWEASAQALRERLKKQP